MKVHRGSIRCWRPEKGASFELTFPLAVVHAALAATLKENSGSGRDWLRSGALCDVFARDGQVRHESRIATRKITEVAVVPRPRPPSPSAGRGSRRSRRRAAG